MIRLNHTYTFDLVSRTRLKFELAFSFSKDHGDTHLCCIDLPGSLLLAGGGSNKGFEFHVRQGSLGDEDGSTTEKHCWTHRVPNIRNIEPETAYVARYNSSHTAFLRIKHVSCACI